MTAIVSQNTVLYVVPVLDALYLSVTLTLVAIGLTVVFGFMDVINAAHGAFWMLGAYFTYWTMGVFGNFWVSIPVVLIAMVVIGYVFEYVLLKPSYSMSPLAQMLITFGGLQVLTGAIYLVFGPRRKSVNLPDELSQTIEILGSSYPQYQIFVIFAGAVLIVVTWAFLQFTDIGLVVRASLLDREMARGLGHDIPTIYTWVFIGSAVLAGWAGMFTVPVRGISPDGGLIILLEAFALVIIGGLGSYKGTVLAAFIVGFVDVFATVYINPRLSGFSIFIVLLVVLLIRPHGFFGVKSVSH